jgi:hypothetical protein
MRVSWDERVIALYFGARLSMLVAGEGEGAYV